MLTVLRSRRTEFTCGSSEPIGVIEKHAAFNVFAAYPLLHGSRIGTTRDYRGLDKPNEGAIAVEAEAKTARRGLRVDNEHVSLVNETFSRLFGEFHPSFSSIHRMAPRIILEKITSAYAGRTASAAFF
jgi:hypothetical protein